MLRSLYLVIAQDCNLACAYCYAQGGDFGLGSSLMEAGTMAAALERLLPLAGKTLAVSFFGGEPLLNFELMKETVAYGQRLSAQRDVRLVYCLTTNGTLLDDDRLAFIKEHIAHLAVSLDGDEQTTDASRRFKDGRGVHGTVSDNLERLRREGIPFALRATVDESCVGGVEAAANYLSRQGAVSLRFAPAAEWKGDSLRAWIDGYSRLNRASLARLLAGEAPLVANEICKVAAHRLLDEKTRYPCGAGQNTLAVAANGTVYPCDHFIGESAFSMGNVHDQAFPGAAFHDVAARLKSNSVEQRPKCAACNVRHVCGGECPAISLARRGNIADPSPGHCAFTRRIARETTALIKNAGEDGKGRLTAFLKGG